MKIQPCIMVFGLWIGWLSTFSQPPAGYYDLTGGITGRALQQVLHDIIDNHTVIPYGNLWDCFRMTDVKNDSIVWDMYSDRPDGIPAYLYKYGKGQECGNYNSEADCYNREHAFPKSWFNDIPPAYSDLFHIYPTDGYVNNKRGNYPFGETKLPVWTSSNGSKLGPSARTGFSGTVFEPVDAYKGDFARSYFYMATRYYGEDNAWPGSEMVSGAEPKPWALSMLLEWHRKDTVSTKETNRNNSVYFFQKNRNPFIDHPEFAEKIWGKINLLGDNYKKEKHLVLFPNPASDIVNLSIAGCDQWNINGKIYNTSGLSVHEFKLDKESNCLDVHHLIPGLYIVRLFSDQENLSGTFIKAGYK